MGSNGELAQIGEPGQHPDYCDAGGIGIGGGGTMREWPGNSQRRVACCGGDRGRLLALYVASPLAFWLLGVPVAGGGFTYFTRRLGTKAGAGEAVVVGLIVLVLAGLLLPAVETRRTPGHRAHCCANLLQIGLGLQSYHDAYGCYPPAYVADAQASRW